MPTSTPTAPAETILPCLTALMQGGGGDTLDGMVAEVQENLAEFAGVVGAGNPVAVRRAVLSAVDEIARRTHCLHTGYLVDLVAHRASYCPPDSTTLLRATAVQVMDLQGYWRSLPVSTGASGAGLRSAFSFWPESDYQYNFAATGSNTITVYPTPLNDRAGALLIEGFYQPGRVWKLNGNTTSADYLQPLPLDGSHRCPLPGYAIDAVKAEATRRRIGQLGLRRKDVMEVLPYWTGEASRLIGHVESTAAGMWEDIARARVSSGLGYGYAV